MSISKKDKAQLAIFVASMMERQPMSRGSLEKFFSDIEEHVKHLRGLPDEAKRRMAQMPISHTGPSISATELLTMGKDIGSLHSSLIPETVVDIAPIIFDMKWCFMIRPNGSEPFITSDNPTIMVNPEAEMEFGRGTMGASPGLIQSDVEITLPLSSDMTLLCGWKLEFDCIYLTIESKEVHQINRRTMRHATMLISSDKSILEQEVDKVKKYQHKK
jgi:hypothetical protein